MIAEKYKDALEQQLLDTKEEFDLLQKVKDDSFSKKSIDTSVFFEVLGQLFRLYIDENVCFDFTENHRIYVYEEDLTAIITFLHALLRSDKAPLRISFRQEEGMFVLFFTEKESGLPISADFSRFPPRLAHALRFWADRSGITLSFRQNDSLSVYIPIYRVAAAVSYTASYEKTYFSLESTLLSVLSLEKKILNKAL